MDVDMHREDMVSTLKWPILSARYGGRIRPGMDVALGRQYENAWMGIKDERERNPGEGYWMTYLTMEIKYRASVEENSALMAMLEI